MTLAEAATVLGLSPATLRWQVRNGKLKARKVGPVWTVTPREVERYQRRHIRRLHPDGGFREPSRVAEFRLGYRQGRDDGARHPLTGLPRTTDWWPDVALGRMDPDTNEPIPGSGAAGLADAIARAASRAALTEKTARAAAETPVAVSVATDGPQAVLGL
jgi:hypothetical protein